jgi:hypothetical protein
MTFVSNIVYPEGLPVGATTSQGMERIRRNVMLDAASVAVFTFGAPLRNTGGGVYSCGYYDLVTDTALQTIDGFIEYTPKYGETALVAGFTDVQMIPSGSGAGMIFTANGAIGVGKYVKYDTTTGKVGLLASNAELNLAIGITKYAATADGDLIEITLTLPNIANETRL